VRNEHIGLNVETHVTTLDELVTCSLAMAKLIDGYSRTRSRTIVTLDIP
jgi:hypothetical protein